MMVSCSECGEKISDRAKFCPKCGAPPLYFPQKTTETISLGKDQIVPFGDILVPKFCEGVEITVTGVTKNKTISCAGCMFCDDTEECAAIHVHHKNAFSVSGGYIHASVVTFKVENRAAIYDTCFYDNFMLVDTTGRQYKGCLLCDYITPPGFLNGGDSVVPQSWGEFIALFPELGPTVEVGKIVFDLSPCGISNFLTFYRETPEPIVESPPEKIPLLSPERDLQVACVNWFKSSIPALRDMLFSVPNSQPDENTRNALKEEGLTAGVADLLLTVPSGPFGCLGLELKSKKGSQSQVQKEWQTAFVAAGNRYVVCRSLVSFQDAVLEYLELEDQN